MALSTLAKKIEAYLKMYKLTAHTYYGRTTGYLDRYYNGSWVEGGITSKGRILPRTQHGLFKTGLAELIAAGPQY